MTLVSRVRLSLWLRIALGGSFGLLAAVLGSAAIARISDDGGVDVISAVELGGAAVCLALAISGALAACTIRVTPAAVTLGFWVLFRARIPASDIDVLRADEWNSWDYGGYGLKGSRSRGWLLNATADPTGSGDVGVLVRTAQGVDYRIEVRDPQRFAERANAVIGPRNVRG